MGKLTICIGENKDADQLRGNREADQRLCFRYSDSRIPPLLNSKISSFKPASVAIQADLCQTCSETTLLVFPRGGSIITALYSIHCPHFLNRKHSIFMFWLQSKYLEPILFRFTIV